MSDDPPFLVGLDLGQTQDFTALAVLDARKFQSAPGHAARGNNQLIAPLTALGCFNPPPATRPGETVWWVPETWPHLALVAQLGPRPVKFPVRFQQSKPRSSLQKVIGAQTLRQLQLQGRQDASLLGVRPRHPVEHQPLTSGCFQMDVADLDLP